MRVKFWGVRGSIPVSSPKNSKYGGNTSCVELNCDEKTIILDSGTGIRALGLDLEERDFVKENGKKDIYIFFSHFHWDHIQGFPFFAPAFVKGNRFDMFGNRKLSSTIAGRSLAK